ncbi:MAG: alpha/beta-hydrolase N-terminal domain-containing protein [Candidatus Nanopelagicales bacterium]
MTAELDAPPRDEPDPDLESPTRARRILGVRFSRTGLTVGAVFLAVSLLPSLLPRTAYVQGVVSGITLMIGYGLGAGGQALWEYLEIPKLRDAPGRSPGSLSWASWD